MPKPTLKPQPRRRAAKAPRKSPLQLEVEAAVESMVAELAEPLRLAVLQGALAELERRA